MLVRRPSVHYRTDAGGVMAYRRSTVRKVDGKMLGWLDDAVSLLVLALAFPLAILVVGTPIAFAVRLLIALGRRWS